MKHKLVNIWTTGKYNIYIGRTNSDFHWGNPFVIGPDCTRKESVEKFDKWFMDIDYQWIEPKRRKWMQDNLYILKYKTLGCFCYPLLCHGNILIREIKKL